MLRPIGMGRSAMKRQQKLKLWRVKVWRHDRRRSGRSGLACHQQLGFCDLRPWALLTAA